MAAFMTTPSDVTRLLHELGQRDGAEEELLPLVYDSLRAIARSRFRKERADHTLQATALVHEAYVRLVGGDPISWQHRAHFFGIAAEAMRRVLIEHARAHASQRRGDGFRAIPLGELDLAQESDLESVVALDDALTALEDEDDRAARIVKLRFYAGLTVDETAEALEVSPRTVAREWEWARARLFELLGLDADEPS